jgi:hypothetical protein
MNSRVAMAKMRSAHLALEDHQLVAKHHDLDVAVQMIRGAGDQLDQAAQQEVREREEHGRSLLRVRKADPINALVEGTIRGLCALQGSG